MFLQISKKYRKGTYLQLPNAWIGQFVDKDVFQLTAKFPIRVKRSSTQLFSWENSKHFTCQSVSTDGWIVSNLHRPNIYSKVIFNLFDLFAEL
jgi:hypothetical protein